MIENREHWSSKLGFILAAAGSAIGLGTMWMLPYVMGQNGGGAFVLVFLIFLICIGIPLFICELMLGRHAQRGVVGTFDYFKPGAKTWRSVGWMGVVCTYLVAGWYTVVAGWGLKYIVLSVTNSFYNKSIEEVSTMYEAFRGTGLECVVWQILFLAITIAIVLRGLAKGIEKYAKVLTSTLFIMLLCLTIYSATLSGFSQAVDYILVPDFSQLSTTSILKALSLALFALSLGEGIMVTYGSYMSEKEDIPRTAGIVGIAIFGISILVSLMIFPMVFTLGLDPQSGEGLIFKILPFVFSQLPGSVIISVVFFSLLLFAALTSAVGQIEVIVANQIDLYGWSRRKSVVLATSIVFLIGLPTALSANSADSKYLQLNYALIDWMLCLFALATAIFVGWVIPCKDAQKGFETGSVQHKYYVMWMFFVRWLVPAAIFAIMLQQARTFDLNAIVS